MIICVRDHDNTTATQVETDIQGISGFPSTPMVSVSVIYRQIASIQMHSDQGFTLIEVMVSMALLITSMLGLAALQHTSIQYSHQAYLRSQGVLQVGDIIDRMRSNISGVRNGYYLVSPIPSDYTKDCSQISVSCTDQELAIYDLVSWNRQNRKLLPSGMGEITYTSTFNHQVTVLWSEQKVQKQTRDDFINPCDQSNNDALRCYILEVRL